MIAFTVCTYVFIHCQRYQYHSVFDKYHISKTYSRGIVLWECDPDYTVITIQRGESARSSGSARSSEKSRTERGFARNMRRKRAHAGSASPFLINYHTGLFAGRSPQSHASGKYGLPSRSGIRCHDFGRSSDHFKFFRRKLSPTIRYTQVSERLCGFSLSSAIVQALS